MSEVDAFMTIPGFSSEALGLWPEDHRAKCLSWPFGSSSACLGAFHHFQAVDRASKALMLDSVLPAARALWRDPRVELADARWVKGRLTASGHPALIWPQLVDQLNRMQRPTVACGTTVSAIANQHVYTVESLAERNRLSPLQQAFLESFAFQGGYCTPGCLMAATAMLDHLKEHGADAGQVDAMIET